MPSIRIEQHGEDVLLWIKAVPGASRNQLAGAVGDRLKIRISAPPEGGKANRAICALLAKALDLRKREVTLDSGHGSPEKIIRIHNATAEALRARLA